MLALVGMEAGYVTAVEGAMGGVMAKDCTGDVEFSAEGDTAKLRGVDKGLRRKSDAAASAAEGEVGVGILGEDVDGGRIRDDGEGEGELVVGTLGNCPAAAAAAASRLVMAPDTGVGGWEGGLAAWLPPPFWETMGSRKETEASLSLPPFWMMAELFFESRTDRSSGPSSMEWPSTQWLPKVSAQPKESLHTKHIRTGLTGTVANSASDEGSLASDLSLPPLSSSLGL